jgi:hypothetical protein
LGGRELHHQAYKAVARAIFAGCLVDFELARGSPRSLRARNAPVAIAVDAGCLLGFELAEGSPGFCELEFVLLHDCS